MGPQERLDPPPQLRIGRALKIQDKAACRGIVAFDGRQKHGLNMLRVEPIGLLSSGKTLRLAVEHGVMMSPEERFNRRENRGARHGHRSISGVPDRR